MSKSTLVQSAESVFVQRLLKLQCPKESWETDFDGKEVVMCEFNFELCCDEDFVVVKSVNSPVKFSNLQ